MNLVQTSVKLYGTGGCHLCATAEGILLQTGAAAERIDIAEDDLLFDKYRLRIPVLQRCDNDAELDWPFDAAAVSDFLG